MKRFQKILYILDEASIAQQTSAGTVAALAHLNGAEVTVLLANDHNFLDNLGLNISGHYEEIQEVIRQENTVKLKTLQDVEYWQNINVITDPTPHTDFISLIQKVLRDDHDLVIREESLEDGIDLLTMKLVRKCPCPVWVIKRNTSNFKKIIAALDLGTEHPESVALNTKILELTHSLAQRGGGEAHYLHAWRLEHELLLKGPRFNLPTDEILRIKTTIQEERLAEMKNILQKSQLPYEESQIHITRGHTDKVIKQTITDLQGDVLVMGSVGRSGIPGLLIGNKVEKLLNSISCTVLTIKPDGFISPITLPQ